VTEADEPVQSIVKNVDAGFADGKPICKFEFSGSSPAPADGTHEITTLGEYCDLVLITQYVHVALGTDIKRKDGCRRGLIEVPDSEVFS
jgi:hypothetical protein